MLFVRFWIDRAAAAVHPRLAGFVYACARDTCGASAVADTSTLATRRLQQSLSPEYAPNEGYRFTPVAGSTLNAALDNAIKLSEVSQSNNGRFGREGSSGDGPAASYTTYTTYSTVEIKEQHSLAFLLLRSHPVFGVAERAI